MRKTKIICTIGPSSESEEIIEKLCLAGMNVARFNFSHGTHEWHKTVMDRVKKVREKLGLPVAIMLDTKGPEYRIGTFACGSVELNDGDRFVFTVDDVEGTREKVSVSFKTLNTELAPGDRIYVNDGIVQFRVDEIKGSDICCTVTAGGTISDRKSMSFPGKVLHQVFLSDRDREDLLFGIRNEVDYVAASFVSNAENVDDIRSFLNANGGESIGIIAKIENQSGVDHIYEIAKKCGGVMVARGDLGVEVPPAQVPHLQKMIIAKCNDAYKIVITATQMLNSMIENPRPTRAEITDVANAIYDGTDCVMLSGETASGRFPVEAVKTMSDICIETEKHLQERKAYHERKGLANVSAATGYSAVFMAEQVGAAAILCPSHSGRTARIVAAYRPDLPILVPSPNEETLRTCCFIWGAKAYKTIEQGTLQNTIYHSLQVAREVGLVNAGELVVITAGDPQTSPRMGNYSTSTNMSMIAQVQ